MTRPQGEFRLAMRSAFAELGRCTWRAAAEHAKVGFTVAQRTTENMARAGELACVARHGPAGVYELASPPSSPTCNAVAQLQAAVRSWADFT